nr:hypothetical protein [uncultured Pseudogulbenkiania sp.]
MATESTQRKPALTLVTSAPAPSQTNTTTDGKPAKAPARRKAKAASAAAEGDYPLRAVLDIEVSWVSKRTIEQVCHLDVPDAELTTEQRRERRLLRDFGLDVAPAIGALPAAIVLVDNRWFKKQRPELKHLANLLEESGGVVPYSLTPMDCPASSRRAPLHPNVAHGPRT